MKAADRPASDGSTTLFGHAKIGMSAHEKPNMVCRFSFERGYSVERLMHFLVALGHDVQIVVKKRKSRGTAQLRVA